MRVAGSNRISIGGSATLRLDIEIIPSNTSRGRSPFAPERPLSTTATRRTPSMGATPGGPSAGPPVVLLGGVDPEEESLEKTHHSRNGHLPGTVGNCWGWSWVWMRLADVVVDGSTQMAPSHHLK